MEATKNRIFRVRRLKIIDLTKGDPLRYLK
jgi:hypothetical protein